MADLDLDGIPEIVAGLSALDRDANLIWGWNSSLSQRTRDNGVTIETFPADVTLALTQPWTAVANLNDDPEPEIIAVRWTGRGGGMDRTNPSDWRQLCKGGTPSRSRLP